MTNLEYQDGGQFSVQDLTSNGRGKPWQQRLNHLLLFTSGVLKYKEQKLRYELLIDEHVIKTLYKLQEVSVIHYSEWVPLGMTAFFFADEFEYFLH